MTTIDASTMIRAPRSAVWEVLADIGGVERYNPLVKRSWHTSSERRGVGAARVCKLAPMGKLEERVSQWEEGESYTIVLTKAKGGPPLSTADAHYRLSDQPGGTRVDLTMRYELGMGPIGSLMDAVMVRSRFRKAASQILDGLREYVEKAEQAKVA